MSQPNLPQEVGTQQNEKPQYSLPLAGHRGHPQGRSNSYATETVTAFKLRGGKRLLYSQDASSTPFPASAPCGELRPLGGLSSAIFFL